MAADGRRRENSNPQQLGEDKPDRVVQPGEEPAATDVYDRGVLVILPPHREVQRTRHAAMHDDDLSQLRVLIANERRDRLELLAQVVVGLGHDVIAREVDVEEVAAVTARESPDVALVGLGSSSEHALDLISEIVREATCPVIAILHADDPAYIHEAAKRGVFAYIVDGSPEELQSAIDITLQRFSEYQSLKGAFGRRAVIEQAKGILMARQAIDAHAAFEVLRGHSQRYGRKLSDVAAAVVESHLLLMPAPPLPTAPGSGPELEPPDTQ